MKRAIAVVLLACAVTCSLPAGPRAYPVNSTIRFAKQVRLPRPATYTFRFSLLADPADVVPVYAESKAIRLRSAILIHYLGSGTVETGAWDAVDFSRQYWVKVERVRTGGDVTLGEPTRLDVVPYALWSGRTSGVSAGQLFCGPGLVGTPNGDTLFIEVIPGTGIGVGNDDVFLDTGYTDVRYVNEEQPDSVSGAMLRHGAVTPEKVNPFGASPGNALVYNGAEVVWQTPAGGGDITGVDAGNGLTEGGTSGDVRISLVAPVAIANGGTGSTVKNFVDLYSDQVLGGCKTFSEAPEFYAAGAPFLVAGNGLVGNLNADQVDGQHAAAFQQRVTGTCPEGFSIMAVYADGAVDCQSTGWSLAGNAGTVPGMNFIGTTDNAALEFRVNGARALRLEPNIISPNVIGGVGDNWIDPGFVGSTIAGGGDPGSDCYGESVPCWNRIFSGYGTIGGGYANTVVGGAATVSGGHRNSARGGEAAVGGGYFNTAEGDWATIPGGRENVAGGNYSFAAGRRAKAYNQGCFVLTDSTDMDLSCNTDNSFLVRASNGFYLYTSPSLTTGAYIAGGGSQWLGVSDRASKEHMTPIDVRDTLARLVSIPIESWNYMSQDPSIRHIGPTAQDFFAAFGLGEDEKRIGTMDSNGVALAAIQGLYEELRDRDRRIAALEARLEEQERVLRRLTPPAAEIR